MRHVITLSTIPPRFGALGPTLASLLAQTSRPEAVEVYIPKSYRRFPKWGGALPEVPEGVRIVRVDADLGPATKILPAARAYRGQDVELLYVDDDTVFLPDWAETSLKLRTEYPGAVICGACENLDRLGRSWVPEGPLPRAVQAPIATGQFGFNLRSLLANAMKPKGTSLYYSVPFRKVDRSGYTDVAAGYGGVAVRPDFLDDAVYDIPPVLWAVDDIWLSGHLARRGIPIWADRSLNKSRVVLSVSKSHGLFWSVIEGADRTTANQACIDYMRSTYGVWGGEAVQST